MAKKQVPARTVTVCDVCGRTSERLRSCRACGREYCPACEADPAGCVVPPDVCRRCPHLDRVRAVCDRYAPKLNKVLDRRDAEIAGLRDPADGPLPPPAPAG